MYGVFFWQETRMECVAQWSSGVLASAHLAPGEPQFGPGEPDFEQLVALVIRSCDLRG